MKKITLFVLTVLLMLGIFASSGTAAGNTVNSGVLSECSPITSYSNIDRYYSGNWSSGVTSYITKTDNGFMTFIADSANGLMAAEYYDKSMKYISAVNVPAELELFGAFYDDGTYYYILTGSRNEAESDSAEVFRITKYDKSWNRLGNASLYGANTYIPFDAGAARMTKWGKYLLIRTCHEMYQSSDGYHHQANVTIQVDTENMTVTDSYTKVMNSSYGYVSHSFNQFIRVENGHIIAADHGDAYPRSICLCVYDSDCSSGSFRGSGWNFCTCYSLLDIYGSIGANYTGATIGGFETTGSSYMAAGSTIPQDGGDHSSKNVYVAVFDKNTTKTTLKYLTSHKDSDVISPSVVQLVKISDSSLCVLWSENGKVYYAFLDASGNLTGSVRSFEGHLSDCAPVVINGAITWFTCNYNARTFYSIPSNGTGTAQITCSETGTHTFSYTNFKNGYADAVCSRCGFKQKCLIPSSFSVYRVENFGSYSMWYSTSGVSDAHPDSEYLFKIESTFPDVSGEQTAEMKKAGENYIITSSDTSIAEVVRLNSNDFNVLIKSTGRASVTIALAADSSLSRVLTFTSSHDYEYTVKKEATAAEEGIREGVCSICGKTIRESIPKLPGQQLDASRVTLSGTAFTYNGNVINPTVTVKNSAGTVLTKDVSYKVSYSSGCKYPGTYTVTVTGIGSYSGTVKKTFTIARQPLSSSRITLSGTSFSYNGNVKKPNVTVKNSAGTVLTKDTSYKVSYSSGCTYPGTYTVTVTGMGNYAGTVKKTFTIAKQSLASSRVTLSKTGFTFNSAVQQPSVTVKNSAGKVLTNGNSYKVSYSSGCRYPGTYTVTVTGIGNYTGSVKKTYTIAKQPLVSSRITLSGTSFTYNGNVKKPNVTVKNSVGTVLTKDTSYKVSYSSGCKYPGTYTVTVTGIGNYTGTVKKTFTIAKQTLSSSRVTLSGTSFTYNGNVKKPTVTVKNSAGTVLTKDTSYTVTYSSGCKLPGTYTVTITGIGNYAGKVNKTFTIKK